MAGRQIEKNINDIELVQTDLRDRSTSIAESNSLAAGFRRRDRLVIIPKTENLI